MDGVGYDWGIKTTKIYAYDYILFTVPLKDLSLTDVFFMLGKSDIGRLLT